MVKAIMHGCNWKMGQVISNLVKEDDGIEIVAGIDKYTGVKNEYPVFTDIADCDVEADVGLISPMHLQWTDCFLTVERKSFRWYFVLLDCLKSSLHRYSVFLKRQQC